MSCRPITLTVAEARALLDALEGDAFETCTQSWNASRARRLRRALDKIDSAVADADFAKAFTENKHGELP